MEATSQILILAAGNGSRFRQQSDVLADQHKALAPLWDERGTLALLLTHLRELNQAANQITIVSGFQARLVQQCANTYFPGARVIPPHPDHAQFSMLQSLQYGLDNSPQTATWVLFADTLYTRAALEQILAHRSNTPAVAAIPLASNKQSTQVTLQASANRVKQFNTEPSKSTHHMAHAVYWPVQYHAQVQQGAKDQKQWHLLQQLCSETPIQLVELAPDAATDIDTVNDLEELRPQVTDKVIDYFNHNLNKDGRTAFAADRLQQQDYVKQTESIAAAQHEAMILRLLQQELPGQAPKLIKVNKKQLVMQGHRGIRLYDLLRQLDNTNEHQIAIRSTLMDRCNTRLKQQQKVLSAHRDAISQTPYPLATQVTELLQMLCTLLRLPAPPSDELNIIDQQWQQACVVPFRDATPKNILLVEPRLCPNLPHPQRQRTLKELLQQPLDYWQTLPIVDVDFTSTKHLTTADDDYLSLNGHRMSLGKRQAPPAVNDLTLLVRYLRFGGRKFAYKLLFPSAYRARFQFDEASFYFQALCDQLSPDFQQTYPQLMQCLRRFRDRAERWRGITLGMQAPDHAVTHIAATTKTLPQMFFWQESTLELAHREELYRLVCRRPFRRSRVDEDTQFDIQRKLNYAHAQQQPIKFSLPFGGYKHPKLPKSPEPNLAERFWLEYLRKYAEPIAALHPAGVEFALSYTSGVLDLINGISSEQQDHYLSRLNALLTHYSCENIRFQLVDIAERMGGSEIARAAMLRKYQQLEQAGQTPSAKSLASAKRNHNGGEPEQAALMCEAMESLPPRRQFNKFGEHIQLTHQKSTLSLHIGSCETSVVQPWVGIGVYERGRPRILSWRQWQQLAHKVNHAQ